jgi:hypothetical protein
MDVTMSCGTNFGGGQDGDTLIRVANGYAGNTGKLRKTANGCSPRQREQNSDGTGIHISGDMSKSKVKLARTTDAYLTGASD